MKVFPTPASRARLVADRPHRILVRRGGKAVERRTHDELTPRDGRHRDLVGLRRLGARAQEGPRS